MIRRHSRRIAATALAASFLLASAGVATADEPGSYVLDVWSCRVTDFDGNPVDANAIPAGSEIFLFEGWIANTRGQVQSFINNATWVLTVNGQSVDVTPTLSGIVNLGPFWGDLFFYDAGMLVSGSITTHFDNVLKSASFDGVFHYAKGSVYNGGVDCTISVG